MTAKAKEQAEADCLRADLQQATKTAEDLQGQLKQIREGSDPREPTLPGHLIF